MGSLFLLQGIFPTQGSNLGLQCGRQILHLSGFPTCAVLKNLPANAGDARNAGSILGLGISPGERNSNSLQYSCLENPMDRGARWATVPGVAKSWTQLSAPTCVCTRAHTHRHTHTHAHISPPSGISFPPPRPHPTRHRSQVITDHSTELPVLYKSVPLAICLHVAAQISQFQSPNSSQPLTWVHTSVLYVCLSIPTLQIGSSCFLIHLIGLIIPETNKNYRNFKAES